MVETVVALWTEWWNQRHPRLLLLATAGAALIALFLMLRISDAGLVLYKEF